jgi:hypothetical protein
MIYQYHITSLLDFGLPGIEVAGEVFHAKDIYEFVGKEQYSTTFTFKIGSDAFVEYGPNVTGYACYDPKTKALLESDCNVAGLQDINRLTIDVALDGLSVTQKHQLRYIGVPITDVESISYLRYKQKVEVHPTGEKKIPNIIEIRADLSEINHDALLSNYLTSKLNRGVRLIDFEREQLAGLLLASDDFKIDVRILDALGFTEEQAKENHAIWRHAYKSLERQGRITPDREDAYKEMKLLESLERLNALIAELSKSDGLNLISSNENEAFRKIGEQAMGFTPSILMHGKQQVYWDLKSYLHIALRHIKDFQLGKFKEKTPFVYKSSDLSSLIEKVLKCVEEDLRTYLAENPTKAFKRHGKMAIEFNGDYYNISIEPSGRIEQFHMLGNV